MKQPAEAPLRSPRVGLYEFVTEFRADIIGRASARLGSRPAPIGGQDELESGVPAFLTQVAETLRRETSPVPFDASAIGDSAARHGAALLAQGYSVAEVVHAYGDVCQAVTEAAIDWNVAITTEEFHTLNRCLDTAIAEAVTEHTRIDAAARAAVETERLGRVAHDSRNHLNAAMLAFEGLRDGKIGVNGSTGAVLGRNLMHLKEILDRTAADVRMAALPPHRERVVLADLLGDLSVTAAMQAEYRGVAFALEPVDTAMIVDADPPLLVSAVTNLLSNAFKFTPAGGHVTLAAHREDVRVRISVADECGGFAEPRSNPFKAFGERRGSDRGGLGLGLSIARRAVRSHDGDIRIESTPGKGCVFIIDLPLAASGVQSLTT